MKNKTTVKMFPVTFSADGTQTIITGAAKIQIVRRRHTPKGKYRYFLNVFSN